MGQIPNDISQRIVDSLLKFDNDNWLEWLEALFTPEPITPVVNFHNAEPIDKLFWLFNILTVKKHTQTLKKLFFAVAKYINTPAVFARIEEISTLIYFINDTKPYIIRPQLEGIIRNEHLKKYETAGVNLQSFMIKAYINIESPELELRSYLDIDVKRNDEPYFYYVYTKYHYKCVNIKAAFEKFALFIYKITPSIAKEISISLKEYILAYKDISGVANGYNDIKITFGVSYRKQVDLLLQSLNGTILSMEKKTKLDHYKGYEQLKNLFMDIVTFESVKSASRFKAIFRDDNQEYEIEVQSHQAMESYKNWKRQRAN